MEDNLKKYLLIGSLILVLIIIIFGFNALKTKPNTLGNVINEFNEIDKKYDGNWRKERIELTNEFGGPTLMPLENIDKAINKLNTLKQDIIEQNLSQKIGTTTLGDLLQNLTQARILMLESEKAFHQAQNMGEEGKISFQYDGPQITITETTNCKDKPALIKTLTLLNETLTKANTAKEMLDNILITHPEAKDIIGVNEKKPNFYNSKLDKAYRQIKINENAAYEQCKAF